MNRGTKLEHTKACVIDPLVNPVSIKNEIFIRDRLRRDFIRALSSYIVNTVDVFHASGGGERGKIGIDASLERVISPFCFSVSLEIASIVLPHVTLNFLSLDKYCC